MLLRIAPLSGELPRLMPEALPETNAQYALDCDFAKGELRGIKKRSTAYTVAGTVRSLYVHPITGRWYSWNHAYPVVPVTGPIVDDQYHRFYFTDGANVRVARGDTGGSGAQPSSYVAGVPAPAYAPLYVEPSSPLPPNVTGYKFYAYCKNGDALSEINNPAATTIVELGKKYRVTLTKTCSTADTNSSQSGATVYSKGNGWYESYDSLIYVPMYSKSSSNALPTASEPFYIRKEDIALTASSITVYVAAGLSYVFYKLADGSYSTKSGDTSLSIGSAASPGSLVFELHIGDTDGNYGVGAWKVSVPLTGYASLPTDIGSGAWSVSVIKESDTQYLFQIGANSGVEARAYAYTYVNQWGEEGDASEPVMFDTVPGLGVSLSLYVDSDGAFVPLSAIRLYRTNTGTNDTSFQFVKEISLTGVTRAAWLPVADAITSDSLGEVISTVGYDLPPTAPSTMALMGNGMLCVAKGNELYVSEPFLPYAFNPGNALAFPHKIVGLCAYENSLFVTTTGVPYLVNGASPDSLVQQALPEVQAGVSQQSITRLGNTVAYLSHDGIVVAQGLNTTIGASLQMFTRKDWRDRYGSKLTQARLAAHDGQLVCTFDDGSEGFVMRLDEANGSFTRYSEPTYCSHVWEVNDWLYTAFGGTIYAFGGDPSATLPFTWWSKDFILPKPANFGALQIHGTGTVTVTLYADGVSRIVKTLTLSSSPTIFRLPSGFVAARWSIKLVGASGASVRWVNLAVSPHEFQNV